MFTVRFADPIAGLSFDRLPRRVQLRFNEAFDLLVQNPRSTTLELDVHQLWGYQNVWTVRLPPWRGIFAIDGNEVVFIVFGHRKNIYPLLHSLVPPERQHVTFARSMRRRSVRAWPKTTPRLVGFPVLGPHARDQDAGLILMPHPDAPAHRAESLVVALNESFSRVLSS